MVRKRMMPSRSSLAPTLRAAFAGGLLALGTALWAADGGFTATLAPDQQTAAGLSTLASTERVALDQLVAVELALVRQGTAQELTGTFVSRRTVAERRLAGLDRLSTAELAKLNELVSAALAARPKPKERPRLKEDDVINAKSKPEIHGAVSLTYGWAGGGRNYRATSLWLDYFDPTTGLGLNFGLTNFSGNGFFDYYPGEYGSRYYSPVPVYDETSYRGHDFSYGSGESFRTPSGWDSSGDGHRRR